MILIFGHDGQIGWELKSELASLGEIYGVSYPEIDFARQDDIRALIKKLKPSLIINAAAYTAVDDAENNEESARAINAVAPGVIAEEAAELGSLFVHYSTDFVFDGEKKQPYNEDDLPNPLSVYGRTKLEGDLAVEEVDGAYLVFRTSWIYGLRGKNFLLTMRRLAQEGKEIRVVDDQTGCPTWCGSVARVTKEVLQRVYGESATLDIEELSGIYNMAADGQASWYKFARSFLPSEVELTPISSDQYSLPAKRPAYSVLNSSRLTQEFGVAMPSWEKGLKDCLA